MQEGAPEGDHLRYNIRVEYDARIESSSSRDSTEAGTILEREDCDRSRDWTEEGPE